MTWTININGHDDLTGDEKVQYEETVVVGAKELAKNLALLGGGHVSSAVANTNTTGSVNLLDVHVTSG